MLQLWLFAPYLPLFYIVDFSVNTADSLGQGVCKYVGENLYLFVCAALRTQAHTKHTHLHVFLFKWPLVVFPWLVISQQQTVKAPTTPTSLSTVAYTISFPCLHIVLNCPREDRDSLSKCDNWHRWDVEVAGHQGLWLHLSISLLSFLETDRSYQLFMMNNAKISNDKCVLRPGQQIYL